MEKSNRITDIRPEDVVLYQTNGRTYRYTSEQLGHGVVKKVFPKHALVKWAAHTRLKLHPFTSLTVTRRPGV